MLHARQNTHWLRNRFLVDHAMRGLVYVMKVSLIGSAVAAVVGIALMMSSSGSSDSWRFPESHPEVLAVLFMALAIPTFLLSLVVGCALLWGLLYLIRRRLGAGARRSPRVEELFR